MPLTVEQVVLEVVRDQYGWKPGEVQLTSALLDLGDSLDFVEVLMAVEEEFGFTDISDEDAEKMRTVKDVVDYVTVHVEARGYLFLPDDERGKR